MTATIFIDGEAGTTGLRIRERLAQRGDIALLHLADADRKDPGARADALNAADVSILCLPDDAARDAVAMIGNNDARVIDASTAHRTAPGWTYGFPELDGAQTGRIAGAGRVANPGCYAVGAVSILHPLIAAGLLEADFPATINAVSGYTGGGRSMIDSYENPDAKNPVSSTFRLYALGLEHKHVEEMRVHSALTHRPLFVPSVGNYAQGMIVSVPLQLWALPGTPTPAKLHAALADYYAGRRFVSVAPLEETASLAYLDPEDVNDTNRMRIYVFGNEQRGQTMIAALLDNLGKGASGQAVQNLNIMLGVDEGEGLT
jgi:N-acetyl-gamma-glutamyl-phosphate reductase